MKSRTILWFGIAAAVSLTPAVAQTTDDPCTPPGALVAEDASNDSGIQPGTGDQDFTDIQSLHIMEPTGTSNLVFTLKMRGLSDMPPGLRWVVRFLPPVPPAGADDYFVGMTTVPGEAGPTGEPAFVWGTTAVEPPGAPAGARLLTVRGDLAEGSGANADGTITLVLDKSIIGSPLAGDEIFPVAPYVRTPVTPQNYGILDETPDGFYAVVGNDFCGDGKSVLGIGSLGGPALAVLALAGFAGLRRRAL